MLSGGGESVHRFLQNHRRDLAGVWGIKRGERDESHVFDEILID